MAEVILELSISCCAPLMRGREGEYKAGVSQSGTEPVCSQYGGPGESGDNGGDEDDALIRVKRVDQEDVGVLERDT